MRDIDGVHCLRESRDTEGTSVRPVNETGLSDKGHCARVGAGRPPFSDLLSLIHSERTTSLLWTGRPLSRKPQILCLFLL